MKIEDIKIWQEVRVEFIGKVEALESYGPHRATITVKINDVYYPVSGVPTENINPLEEPKGVA